MDTSVRPPRVLTRSFPLMTVPFTAGAPCSYWTLTCIAVSSALHSLMGFLFVSPVVCLQLPSDSTSRWTPLLFSYPLPTAGQGRDFHPIERAPAGRTTQRGAPSPGLPFVLAGSSPVCVISRITYSLRLPWALPKLPVPSKHQPQLPLWFLLPVPPLQPQPAPP